MSSLLSFWKVLFNLLQNRFFQNDKSELKELELFNIIIFAKHELFVSALNN